MGVAEVGEVLEKRLVRLDPNYYKFYRMGLKGELGNQALLNVLGNTLVNGSFSILRGRFFDGLKKGILEEGRAYPKHNYPIRIGVRTAEQNTELPLHTFGTDTNGNPHYDPFSMGLKAVKTLEGQMGFYTGIRSQPPKPSKGTVPDGDLVKLRNFQYGYRLGFIIWIAEHYGPQLQSRNGHGTRVLLNADQIPLDVDSYNAFMEGLDGINRADGVRGEFPIINGIKLDYKANQAGLAIYKALKV